MKSTKSKIVAVVIILVTLVLVIGVGASFAYILQSSTSNNTYKISTGNINATVTFTNKNLTLSAMSDADGMNQTDYGTIQISKTHNYSIFYTINVGYKSGSTTASIPLEYVRGALYSVSGSTQTLLTGPFTLADLPVSSVTSSNGLTALYKAGYGTFAPGSQSAKYVLKVWLDKYTPKTYNGKTVNLDVSVDEIEKLYNVYSNFTGTVVGGDSGEATISFANGMITKTTSSRAFTLSNVPSGVYNLDVTIGSSKYSTTVDIEPSTSDTYAISKTSTGSGSGYMQALAYQYKTTPLKIKTLNNTSSTTNENITTQLSIPSSHNIYVIDKLETDTYTLKLTLSGSDITISKN